MGEAKNGVGKSGRGGWSGGGGEEVDSQPGLGKGSPQRPRKPSSGPGMQRMPHRVGLKSRPGGYQSWCEQPTGFGLTGEERERRCSRIAN